MTSKELTQNVPREGQKPRISKRLRQAIELLASGECRTQKAAAERAGISQEHLSKMLQRPSIRGVLIERAAKSIDAATPRAAARLVELLDASSEHVSLDASARLLGMQGFRTAETPRSPLNINIGVMPGYVVLGPGHDRNQGPVVEAEVVANPSQDGDE
jgi:hypothetical protein